MSAVTKWTDPFDDMSDEGLDEHVDQLFSQRLGWWTDYSEPRQTCWNG